MAFSDEIDWEEIEWQKAEMEREEKEEYEAEQREQERLAFNNRPKSTDDFHTYNSRPDDEYSDDPDNHPFDCMCFLCIPGF